MDRKLGWPDSDETFGFLTKQFPFGASKIGNTLLAGLLQKSLEESNQGILANVVCLCLQEPCNILVTRCI